jgi:hypothetical protein
MSYTPELMFITSITNANPAVVTTSLNHNMTTGQIVRINIPKAFGMQELTQVNNRLFSITVLSPTSYSLQISQIPNYVNLNSILFSPFTFTTSGTPSTAFPVGSGPTPVLNTFVSVQNGNALTLLDDATTNVAVTNQPF